MQTNANDSLHLVVLDPGHFHAALVQKSMYPEMSPVVNVYAPGGKEVEDYLGLIRKYNSQADQPTHWEEKVYTGPDYLDKMLGDKAGNLVIIAGNNREKTRYIKKAVDAGIHVLADKPMAIDSAGFRLLESAFADAKQHGVLLYDIMTERYEITNVLQKACTQLGIFGTLENGTEKDPSVISESVHYFYKEVSGDTLTRPAWYYDVTQQGDGIVDVTTHLIDLIQWELFSGTSPDYHRDVQVHSARRWPTHITPEQFTRSTHVDAYPQFLRTAVRDSILEVYANGEINYSLRGVHARVGVRWDFQAPPGSGDTYYSRIRGSKADLVIRQDKASGYRPALFIELRHPPEEKEALTLTQEFSAIQKKYPGVTLKKQDDKSWEVVIPAQYRLGHEAHFALVMKKYLEYLKAGKMPEWETAAMLTKYYITTRALSIAQTTE
ncbi:putative oxidoreductase C-terminal domain-containing protein [Compostibacter hankyongensis]|uniref:Oxidoreductase C-terminal domain-containing protein n=1 Tax=Compostibacter hankyongensis TaxID=1007089 RepID=A0ABP8G9N1_9BACT